MFRQLMATLTIASCCITPAEAACDEAQNQQEINQCAYAEFEAADAELNKAYKQLRAAIEPDHENALRAAQRAWVTLRDAECEFESMGWEGGSGRAMIQSACLKRMTEERSARLKVFLTCNPESYEGDVECPPKR